MNNTIDVLCGMADDGMAVATSSEIVRRSPVWLHPCPGLASLSFLTELAGMRVAAPPPEWMEAILTRVLAQVRPVIPNHQPSRV